MLYILYKKNGLRNWLYKAPVTPNGDATALVQCSKQRLYSVYDASTARKQLLRRVHGALTAFSRRS